MKCPHCGSDVNPAYDTCPSCAGKYYVLKPTPPSIFSGMPLWGKILYLIFVVAVVGTIVGGMVYMVLTQEPQTY